MNRLTHKRATRSQRKTRIRNRVKGNADRPRLTVTISNKNVSAQIIDDSAGKTLVSASSLTVKEGSLSKKAEAVGADIAKQAKAKKISKVVMDRNGRLYEQRLNSFAEAARKAGLEF